MNRINVHGVELEVRLVPINGGKAPVLKPRDLAIIERAFRRIASQPPINTTHGEDSVKHVRRLRSPMRKAT